MKTEKTFKSGGGFTFIEIMITVMILGIVVAIAIPHFMKSRKRAHMNTCISNLRQINSAKTQASFNTTDFCNSEILFGPSCYIRVTPACPLTKSSYSINNGDSFPTCPNYTADIDYPHIMPAEMY
jgi:prepilin-type N-terminal cleavage/methylation domain-containing protein